MKSQYLLALCIMYQILFFSTVILIKHWVSISQTYNSQTILDIISFGLFLYFNPGNVYKIIIFINLKLYILYDFRELNFLQFYKNLDRVSSI